MAALFGGVGEPVKTFEVDMIERIKKKAQKKSRNTKKQDEDEESEVKMRNVSTERWMKWNRSPEEVER